jgi:hypothetical protein
MSKRLVVAVLVIGFLGGWIVADLSRTLVYSQEKDKEKEAKNPVWSHSMDLRVRKAGELDFTPQTKKWGIEVFRDGNNGNLIYISETGSISVVPGK